MKAIVPANPKKYPFTCLVAQPSNRTCVADGLRCKVTLLRPPGLPPARLIPVGNAGAAERVNAVLTVISTCGVSINCTGTPGALAGVREGAVELDASVIETTGVEVAEASTFVLLEGWTVARLLSTVLPRVSAFEVELAAIDIPTLIEPAALLEEAKLFISLLLVEALAVEGIRLLNDFDFPGLVVGIEPAFPIFEP